MNAMSEKEQCRSNDTRKKSAQDEHRLAVHFTTDIRPTLFAESQLIILTFCTGIQGEFQLTFICCMFRWLTDVRQ